MELGEVNFRITLVVTHRTDNGDTCSRRGGLRESLGAPGEGAEGGQCDGDKQDRGDSRFGRPRRSLGLRFPAGV